MNAYGVQIRFQAKDLEHVTTTVSAHTFSYLIALWDVETDLESMSEHASKQQASTQSPTSSPGATPVSPDPTPTNTTPPSPGLSAGAEAGIGVGAAVGVCIGLVLLWLGWRRHKRRRALPVRAESGANYGEPQIQHGLKHAPIEAKYNGPFEAQAGEPHHELPGQDPHRELPGQHTVHRHELEGPGR